LTDLNIIRFTAGFKK